MNFLNKLLGFSNHVSEENYRLYKKGELTAKHYKQVKVHLRECEKCKLLARKDQRFTIETLKQTLGETHLDQNRLIALNDKTMHRVDFAWLVEHISECRKCRSLVPQLTEAEIRSRLPLHYDSGLCDETVDYYLNPIFYEDLTEADIARAHTEINVRVLRISGRRKMANIFDEIMSET